MKVEKYDNRHWALREDNDTLVCVTVYKKGAEEVLRRFTKLEKYLFQESSGTFDKSKTSDKMMMDLINQKIKCPHIAPSVATSQTRTKR